MDKKTASILLIQRKGLYISMIVMAVAAIAISVVTLLSSVKIYSNFNSKMSDLVFVMLMLVAFFAQMLLPVAMEKLFRIKISPLISSLFILQCFLGTFLGNVANLYYIIPYYNKFVHFMLGVSLSTIGLACLQFLNKNEDVNLRASFIALFVFFTGIAISVFWEFLEFFADLILDMNMQSYANEAGELLVGRAAIFDTMLDLLFNTAGALTVAVPVHISFKYKKSWHKYFQILKHERIKSPQTL